MSCGITLDILVCALRCCLLLGLCFSEQLSSNWTIYRNIKKTEVFWLNYMQWFLFCCTRVIYTVHYTGTLRLLDMTVLVFRRIHYRQCFPHQNIQKVFSLENQSYLPYTKKNDFIDLKKYPSPHIPLNITCSLGSQVEFCLNNEY